MVQVRHSKPIQARLNRYPLQYPLQSKLSVCTTNQEFCLFIGQVADARMLSLKICQMVASGLSLNVFIRREAHHHLLCALGRVAT